MRYLKVINKTSVHSEKARYVLQYMYVCMYLPDLTASQQVPQSVIFKFSGLIYAM